MSVLLGLMLAATGAAVDVTPKDPAEAIALADAHPERSTRGVYRMTVAAAERNPKALYLNSSTDYRAPDDMTFRLTSSAARTLEKRLGAKPEVALIGRTVTVRGDIRAVPIVNTFGGRPRSFNRYQHSVLVHDASQLSVE